jgi:hypothetical protein
MKAALPFWSALCLVLGLVSPNRVYGEVGCLVVEIMMDQPAPLSEPVDQQPSAERELTSSVHPRGKVKPVKNAQGPAPPSLTDQARVKAFMSGQDMADYYSDTKIVEGNESGRYRRRK